MESNWTFWDCFLKGKGNSYREIKLLEHAFKLHKKVLDGHLCEVVYIDKMQYGFMTGRGTVDAVFVQRRLKNSKPKIRSRFLNLLT